MMPEWCAPPSLAWLDATLSDFWLAASFGLIGLIFIFAVVSSWISPFAAGITPAERNKRMPLSRSWVLATSALSAVLLLGALVLAVQPVGCARHAFLVSAHVPPGATDWDAHVTDFRDRLRAEALREGRRLVDLAPMRDRILEAFAGNTVAENHAARLPELVRDALADFTRGVLPRLPSEASNRLTRNLDPAFIETVEFAVLQAWRAFYPGTHQRISYFVSDRAVEHEWDWAHLAAARLGGAEIRTVRLRRNAPEISRVVSARRSDDGQSLYALVLFSLPPEMASSSSVPLRLVDRSGNPIGNGHAQLQPNRDGLQLSEVVFSRIAGDADLRAAARIVQAAVQGVSPEAALPPIRRSPLLVTVDAPATQRIQIEQTLQFLANPIQGCAEGDGPLRHRAAVWPQTFAVPSDGAPVVTTRAADSDVIIRANHQGVLLVLPAHVQFSGARLDGSPYEWLASPLGLDGELHRELQASPPEPSADLFVLWDLSGATQMFSVNRLGVSGAAAGALKVFPAQGTTDIPRERLFITTSRRADLGRQRLGLDANATVAGHLERRWNLPDRNVRGIVRSAVALGIDLDALDVLCGTAVSDPDLFFGVWRLIFERMLMAATPRPSLTLPTTITGGTPRVVLSQADLRAIAIQRLVNPVLTVIAVLTLHLMLIALSYRAAGRVQRTD